MQVKICHNDQPRIRESLFYSLVMKVAIDRNFKIVIQAWGEVRTKELYSDLKHLTK